MFSGRKTAKMENPKILYYLMRVLRLRCNFKLYQQQLILLILYLLLFRRLKLVEMFLSKLEMKMIFKRAKKMVQMTL